MADGLHTGQTATSLYLYVIKVGCRQFGFMPALSAEFILDKPEAALYILQLLPTGALLFVSADLAQMLQDGPARHKDACK